MPRPGPTRPGLLKCNFLAVKPNPPLWPRLHRCVLRLRLPGLGNLRLDHRLGDFPPLWVWVCAPRIDRIQADVKDVPAAEALGKLRENRVIGPHPLRVWEVEGEQLSAHGGVG